MVIVWVSSISVDLGVGSHVWYLPYKLGLDLGSVRVEDVDSIVKSQEVMESGSYLLPKLWDLINPMVHWTFLGLDGVDILSPSSVLDAGLVDWESVGSESYILRVLWEDKVTPATVATVLWAPSSHRLSRLSEVVSDSLKVEGPLVASCVGLSVILFEDISPFSFWGNMVDSCKYLSLATCHINLIESLDQLYELSEGRVLVVVDWGVVDTEESSCFVMVSNRGSKGKVASNSVATEGGSTHLVLPHVSGDIVSDVSGLEACVSVRISEISWVQNMNISVFEDMIIRVGEEWDPVFDLVEEVWDEDEIWEVSVSSLDLNTSEGDIVIRGYCFRVSVVVLDLVIAYHSSQWGHP